MSTGSSYRAVPSRVDLPALDREVLDLWRENRIFERSLEASGPDGADRPTWVFYEGPPTANGMPGTHHVEARVFKDVFPRYRTMKGYHVPRKAGWDCHGLPVELAVEKELGFSGKQDIEEYGVAAFNAKCRDSVERHVGAFEAMTERMGYWVDMSQAYRTMDADYVESVWWSLKQIWDKGLLVEDHRVAPYCPRCGTGLSDHELAQGYETVVDPSVYVRFPVTDGPLAELGAALLVWTTTPWTLVSNTAVAVKPDVTYVAARVATTDGGSEVLVVAEPLLAAALGESAEDAEIVGSWTGVELERTSYSRPFDLVDLDAFKDADGRSHYVVLADYVTTDDGTGLVHQAPAFGADDLMVCRAYGLPVVNPVRKDGHFEESVPLVGDVFFKKADEALVADLQARGLMFKHLPYEHAYPHCWRCHTPLVYYAQPSWYIRTTAVKDRMLEENEKTNWFPSTIQWGRYGDWLHNNIDWALSRNRYWGTPLPVWRCDEGHAVCIGSLAELGELAGQELSSLDPHRPYVDDVVLTCAECGGESRRVPEVIDGWYDSGAMPFAQWGYPYRNKEIFEARYPADFICEAIDQTRGWFYTLMAVGTLVFDESSYENVLCLGHILDEEGRKMSKHLGNVLEPIPLMDEHGADAVRWFMAAGGSPWQARRVGHAAIADVVRKTLMTYWNTVSFHTLYANANDWSPATGDVPPVGERPVLDRWAISALNTLARDTDAAYEGFDTQRVGRLISAFVDDLSNWYVRRSRRRFWDGDPAALATLHECLTTVTLVMAPLVPFVTERVWQDVVLPVTPGAPDSVHLAPWPEHDPALIDPEVDDQVALVRRLVELGRAARADSGLKTRQPLARALVAAPGFDALPADARAEIAEELNVESVDALGTAAGLVELSVKANFRSLGKRYGKTTPDVAAEVVAADAPVLVAALREHGTTTLPSGATVTLEDVIVTETPSEGWTVASGDGDTVALDLALTPALRRAGVARDVVRLVQEARKAAGLEVTDRITWWWEAADTDGATAQAVREHAATVADEVLAVAVHEGAPGASDGAVRTDADDLGLTFWLRRN
jgi:isoleucyl-tRNA synthetase